MTVPSPHFDDDSADPEPGGLLGDLESRQDDVLNQLDELDAKLNQVLEGLETGNSLPPVANSDEGLEEAATDSGGVSQENLMLDSLRELIDSEFDEDFDPEDFDADDYGSAEDWA